MGANGEDLRELKKAQDDQRESHEGLKKRVNDLDSATGKAIVKLSTEAKWIKWLLVFLCAVGVLNGVINFFSK